MKTSVAASTHVGLVRESNEDYFIIEPTLNLYLVCDGMGGHAAGEVASKSAAEFVLKFLTAHREDMESLCAISDYSGLEKLIIRAVNFACREVNDMSRSDLMLAGMGTTLTLVMIADDIAIMAHVGDSQLYHLHKQKVHMRSHDHTLAAELLASGNLADSSWVNNFQHVLTRSIGPTRDVEVETSIIKLSTGDVLLLCTDGLTRAVNDLSELHPFLARPVNPESAEALIDYANLKGGRDNVTVMLIQLDESPMPTLS